jgi:hypothetical protein
MTKSTWRRRLTPETPSELLRFRPAASRRRRHFLESVHHGDIHGGSGLILFEVELGHDVTFGTRDVSRRQPVERIDEYVGTAERTTAKGGEVANEPVVFVDYVFFDLVVENDVTHSTTSCGVVTTEPMKVDPVVPVSCTW